MNISEDKFLNKSAEEIVDDILLQYKNNTKDALAYLQELSTNDGLVSSENLSKLKKAEDLLKNKAKKEALIEKFWPFDIFKKRYDIELSCIPPFMKEPIRITLTDTTGFDDPKVVEAYQKIRKKHPKSIIYARNPELGTKTFYENSIRDFKLKLYKENNLIESAYVGNLQIAKKLSETICENNNEYTKVEILKENKIVDVYNKLKNKKFIWNNKDNNKNKKEKNKDNTLTKLMNDFSNNKEVQNIEANLLSTVTGIAPQFLGGVTKALNTAIKMPFKKPVREDTDDKKYGTSDKMLDKDFINPVQDTNNIDNRILLALHGIHPNLIDLRKPKLNWPEKWNTQLLSNGIPHTVAAQDIKNNYDNLSAPVLFVLNGMYDNDKPLPTEEELSNPELLEKYKEQYVSDNDQVVMIPKIPSTFNGYSVKTGEPLYTYKDGKPFILTVKNFKRLLNDPVNISKLDRFQNKNDMSSEGITNILSRDIIAKNYMDDNYDNWEAEYKDLYNLEAYDLPIRSNIYIEWKKYNNEHKELTPEIVYDKFFLPQYRDKLNQNDNVTIQSIENLIAALPENEKQKITKQYLNLISETPETDLTLTLVKFKNEIGQKTACWNQINTVVNGSLYELENELQNHPSLLKLLEKFKATIVDECTIKDGPFKGLPDSKKINSSNFKEYVKSVIAKFNSKFEKTPIKINKEPSFSDTDIEDVSSSLKRNMDNVFDKAKHMINTIPDINITEEKRQEYLSELNELKVQLINKKISDPEFTIDDIIKIVQNFKDKIREETHTKRTSLDNKLSTKYNDALYAELNDLDNNDNEEE